MVSKKLTKARKRSWKAFDEQSQARAVNQAIRELKDELRRKQKAID